MEAFGDGSARFWQLANCTRQSSPKATLSRIGKTRIGRVLKERSQFDPCEGLEDRRSLEASTQFVRGVSLFKEHPPHPTCFSLKKTLHPDLSVIPLDWPTVAATGMQTDRQTECQFAR